MKFCQAGCCNPVGVPEVTTLREPAESQACLALEVAQLSSPNSAGETESQRLLRLILACTGSPAAESRSQVQSGLPILECVRFVNKPFSHHHQTFVCYRAARSWEVPLTHGQSGASITWGRARGQAAESCKGNRNVLLSFIFYHQCFKSSAHLSDKSQKEWIKISQYKFDLVEIFSSPWPLFHQCLLCSKSQPDFEV